MDKFKEENISKYATTHLIKDPKVPSNSNKRGKKLFSVLLLMSFSLSGCSFMGIHDQSFECPPEDGIKCASTSRVNQAADLLKEDSKKEGSIDEEAVKGDSKDCHKKQCQRSKRPSFPSYTTFQSSGDEGVKTKAGYSRTPEQTMSIWLAPQSVEGGMVEETYARIVSVDAGWVRSSPLPKDEG